jgi:hypothetical protein
LTITTSARHTPGGSGWVVIRKPALAISANILSLSTMFLGQPSAIKPTVPRLRSRRGEAPRRSPTGW